MRWCGWAVAAVCLLWGCRDHGGPGPSIDDSTEPDAAAPDAGLHQVGPCNSVQVIQDRDGDGVAARWSMGCGFPAMPLRAPGATDCDDTNAAIFQEAWLDADGDGWTVGNGACFGELPPGYTTQSLGEDCDDADPNVQMLAYTDADGDGFGAAAQCAAATPTGSPLPKGLAYGTGDCDDQNAQVHPEALEQWHDDVDTDCDGQKDPLECDGKNVYAEDPMCGCALLSAPRVTIDTACVGVGLFLAQQVTCADCFERNIFVVGNRGTAPTTGGFDFTLSGHPTTVLHVTGDIAPGTVSDPVVVHARGESLHFVDAGPCAGDSAADPSLDVAPQCILP